MSRLNLLLTAPHCPQSDSQPWHQTVARLLIPMGVRTFEASSGPQAVELMEKHPIHMAVVDTRLPTFGGLSVLELVERLRRQSRAHCLPQSPPPTESFRFQMRVEEHSSAGQARRIEVRIDSRPAPHPGPVVILIAPPPPQQDPQLLQEALKFNAFSVLSEPVDVNLALEVMARALRRFHHNQWPS